jgi:phosphoribosylaminoimidazolecarboxamide formyltransferase / IMP cyclohydrolase
VNRVGKIDDRISIRRVLMSVSDKSGLEALVEGFDGVDGLVIYSTGGTHARIAEILGDEGRSRLKQVSEYTGQPEMQGGLVKTLDFRIYLGLLSEPYNDAHTADRRRLDADLIDMVVVNLYPFRSVASRTGADAEDARSNIDIGGPCMLRAAAKSYLRVASVCDPSDYPAIVRELAANDATIGLDTRYRLAQKAFGHTAAYDTAIAEYLAERSLEQATAPYEVVR